MEIETLSRAEYYKARATVDKAESLLRREWPEWEKGGAIPKAVCASPVYRAATNEMRGRVEQFELLHNPPESFVAYIGAPNRNGMGIDRVAGQSWPVTVWTGAAVGYATRGAQWRVNSHWGSHMAQFYCRMAGREYTGRGFGEGMAIAFRETAESKRNRGAAN